MCLQMRTIVIIILIANSCLAIFLLIYTTKVLCKVDVVVLRIVNGVNMNRALLVTEISNM